MSGSLFFYINGKAFTVPGPDAFETLSNFLRYRLRATGTKIVCEEGDCGACTVLIGRPEGDRLNYLPINSCIQFLYQINGTHIVTVEGLGSSTNLHPVQDAMVRCHGAQCGFCTPGFVVAMCAMYEGSGRPAEATIREALTGNLCRCTGYEPIIKAALAVDPEKVAPLNLRYPPGPIVDRLRQHSSQALIVETPGRRFFSPTTVEQAVGFKKENPGAVIVQGGTDIAVQHNKRGFDPTFVMNLSNVSELAALTEERGVLSVGATVSLSRLKEAVFERVPEFGDILELFGAPQIRHAGTLAGNIANASPIADSLPFLYVMNAEVELAGSSGRRLVPISSFYLGYKKLDLSADEIITRVLIPLPGTSSGEVLKLYKVSKRRNLDISTFTAAIRISLKDDRVGQVRVAYGGVGPTVVRLPLTEAFLEGRQLSLENFRSAGDRARDEISPITDVRGTAAFRSQLAQNILLKFYYDLASEQNRIAGVAS